MRRRGSRSSQGVGERPEVLRVWLLGGFSVSAGTRTVGEDEWRTRKARSLIKLLALSPSHRMHREELTDTLWPELEWEAAANNLRGALHAARRALSEDPDESTRCLRLRDEEIALCPDGALWVDVEALEEAVVVARRAREPTAYQAAIELYSGELLPEDRYEAWVEDRREELRETYLTMLLELAGLHEERGEYGPGIEASKKALAAEPAHEEARAGLMRLYALSGRRREALRQYALLSEVLSRDLGAQPGTESRRLHEEILSGRFPPARAHDHPPEEAPGSAPHNLPVARGSFVGREREVAEVKRTLAMTGLLTLTGAGGSGKTRLALEVARELVSAYPDGVWFVELAGLSEGELVPRAVASALGVREQPGRTLVETLVDVLRGKKMLLVLDNCEHLVDAAARLADTLLYSCPRLRILGPGSTEWQAAYHRYAAPGTYTVRVTSVRQCPEYAGDTYEDSNPVVIEPKSATCNAATSSSASDRSSPRNLPPFVPPCEVPPPKDDCVVSFFGAFCLVDTKLKDAYDKYKELKEKYEEAKKIVDPKERKKALKEIAQEKNVAQAEYKKLLEDSKKQAKENAKKFNLPQEKMGKKINKALRGDY